MARKPRWRRAAVGLILLLLVIGGYGVLVRGRSPLKVSSDGLRTRVSERYRLIAKAQDPRRGAIFYVLEPRFASPPDHRYWRSFRAFVYEDGRLSEARIARGQYLPEGPGRISGVWTGAKEHLDGRLWVAFFHRGGTYQLHCAHGMSPATKLPPILIHFDDVSAHMAGLVGAFGYQLSVEQELVDLLR